MQNLPNFVFQQVVNAAVTTHYEVSRLGVKVDINNPRKHIALAGGFIEILYTYFLIYYQREMHLVELLRSTVALLASRESPNH